MASRSETRQRNRSSNQRSRSAFSWGRRNAGALAGAAAAGAALTVAANVGRKLFAMGFPTSPLSWDATLAEQHEAALATMDALLATDSSQTAKRASLLARLTHALDVHAHEEEMVVYPALREANEERDADLLEHEHGYVKTFLYELNKMEADSPKFLETVRKLRDLVAEHAKMEEEQVFPHFKNEMSDEQNEKITSLMKRDEFRMA